MTAHPFMALDQYLKTISGLQMLLVENQRAQRLQLAERMAERILERYDPQPGDMLFVISDNGVNRLPRAAEATLAAYESDRTGTTIEGKRA